MTATLATRDLAIGYPARTIAEGLNLSLHPGEVVALIGPNGTGKTTLLRTLAGLLSPRSGAIELVGDPLNTLSVRERAKRAAVVLTERPQTGWLTGFDLAAAGRYPHTGWQGRLHQDDRAVVDGALERVGAAAFRDRPVASLSDGERQRVMVARALAQEPRLLLLDEVTSFLDLPRRVAFFALLGELAGQGHAIVISTHELELALRCADRLWLFDGARLLDAAPEDLILSGDFARIFAGEGVQFDVDAGHFELRRAAERFVRIESEEGSRATWTRRALERIGVGVAHDAERTIIVEPARWRYDGAHHSTIASLLRALR